jgi:uncharacterized protein (AIM24 family)
VQGDIFGNPEVPGDRPFVNQNSKMLKATIGPYGEVLAKQGAMVAYQGQIDFDYELQSLGQAQRLILTGERLSLMRCSGQGELFLAEAARDIHVLELEGDGICVDGSNLLAMDSGLHWDVVRVAGAVGVPGAGKAQININGRGPVAILTSGHPLVLRVTPGGYTFCDADAVIAWSTALRVSTQAAVTTSSAMSLRADSGEGWQMQFQGDGWVVVQPAELAPPTQLAGQGWQSQDPRNFRGGGFQY